MKLEKCKWLLMCVCAATFGWSTNTSIAQQPSSFLQGYYPQGNSQDHLGESEDQSIELIPYDQSRQVTNYHGAKLKRLNREEASQQRFEPRPHDLERAQALQNRRAYRAAYQEGLVDPNAVAPDQAFPRQQSGGSGHRGGHGGGPGHCRSCRGGGHGSQTRQQQGPPGPQQFNQRPFNNERPFGNERQFNNERHFNNERPFQNGPFNNEGPFNNNGPLGEADIPPHLNVSSPRRPAWQWRNDPFDTAR